MVKLGKELSNLLGGKGAAVTDLAQLGALGNLSNPGGGGEFKLGGHGGDLGVEEGQDPVVVGDGTGGQVADQPPVALAGLGSAQDGESSVVAVGLGVTAASAVGGEDGGAEDKTLEEDSATQKAEGGDGGGAEGGGSAGGGGGGGADDEGGLRHGGEGQDNQSGAEDGVHAAMI